jgi:serine/threonine-protein kinase
MNDHFKNEAGERVLSGRYRIIRPLASGGMARVFLAEDLRLQRQVAIKVIHQHLAEDPTFIEKFRREAIIAAGLNHPNLVNIFDQGSDGSATYLVMEYVSGRTLRDVLKEFGALPPIRALEIIEAVLGGLSAAHSAGILHRDIKPENVLLADDGRIKLSDFGLARPISANTETESVIGTAAYLSPELVTRGATDARSDVYAMGILLFELVTGHQPFSGDHAAHIAAQHAASSVVAPSTINAEVPPLVDELVLYATEREPSNRPADAGILLGLVRRAKQELKSAKPGSAISANTIRITPSNPTPNASTQATTVIAPIGADATGEISNATQVIGGGIQEDVEHPLLSFGGRKQFLKWFISSVLAVLLGAGVGWWFGAGPGALRAIPVVQSNQVLEATTTLQNLGFVVKVEQEFSKSIDQGLVTRTQPAAGALLAAGSKVQLFVSLGKEMKVVPMLTGLDVATATERLLAAGFAFGGAEAWFNSASVGNVFDYLGSDGKKQPAGSAITVKLSLGPMPAVNNIPQNAAVALLTSVGLKIGSVTSEYSETVDSGNVINLIPQSQPIGKNGTVNLVVSKGSQKVIMPKVVGETIAAAQSVLQALGLVVIIDTNKLQSQYGIAKVKKVSVAPGLTLRKGDSVTIISR